MIVEHDAAAPATMTTAQDDLVESHEQAAHEKRNWVRLSYDCNNACLFCLDSLAHDGTMRSNLDIKVQILEGRKKGAERLILSGGEPTMHPNFLDFVKLGRRAGYPKIQTVTNGRMFAYPEFLQQAADNGLDEVTFSLHGHTAKLHDGLVATPGAFAQETAGLKAALASGRFIVNIDIVINKRNVRHLPEMLETFIGWGVKEFDLLHIIPFGAAWGRARDHLFYDLDGNEEFLHRALQYSRRPDIHIWLNRFPPPYTEGFEDLIQDPYKMNDEVRGRRDEYDRYLSTGEKLSCRQPERCRYCYLQQLCDTLDEAIADRALPEVDVLRIEVPGPAAATLPRARVLHVVAPDLRAAAAAIQTTSAEVVWLELESYAGLVERLDDGQRIAGKRIERCYVSNVEDLAALCAADRGFDVVAQLTRDTAPLVASAPYPERLIVRQPNYPRVTEQRQRDVALKDFFRKLPTAVRTENIPPCLSGRPPAAAPSRLDGGMLGNDGRVDMGRYTHRYISDRYYTKSRRCRACTYNAQCPGVHINFVRAHGYAPLEPIRNASDELPSQDALEV